MHDLWQTISRFFSSGDISGAAAHLESLLRADASDRFVPLADKHFTNSPHAVLEHLNAFIGGCSEEFDVQAVYLEMNGFDINYGRWYFDSFGYKQYVPDQADLEWLCDWSSLRWPEFTLTGLEDIQEDFRWYMENAIYDKKTHETPEELAVLLVMVRFVRLVETTLQSGDLVKPVPVFATAHDFDIVGRFFPR